MESEFYLFETSFAHIKYKNRASEVYLWTLSQEVRCYLTNYNVIKNKYFVLYC